MTRRGPKHPGGDVIYINAGKDATLLFDSYHSDSARFVSFLFPSHSVAAARLTTNPPPSFFFIRSKVLDKYYIGELQRVSGDELFVDYSETQDAFYRTVKQRVRKYFKFAPLDQFPSFSALPASLLILMLLSFTSERTTLTRESLSSCM